MPSSCEELGAAELETLFYAPKNRNVFRWLKKGKANHGKASRILKFAMDFVIKHNIEVVPQYLRSAHNISADGLTRWDESGIMDWLRQERMTQVGVTAEWMHALNDTIDDLGDPRFITQIRGRMVGFLRDSNNKVCEWRPGCYTTAAILWNWGSPCWAYGILRPTIQSLVDFHVQERATRDDIFGLIGCAYSQLEIDDFKRDVRHIVPRYAILITPSWAHDLRQPGNFWTCQRLLDSAGLGGVCSAQWWVYGCGPTDSHFDFSPFTRDVRVLHHGYANAGLPCADDPVGVTRVMGIPNSSGRKVTIRADPETVRMCRFPHFPMPGAAVVRGVNAHWPLVSPEMRIPYICEKLVI